MAAICDVGTVWLCVDPRPPHHGSVGNNRSYDCGVCPIQFQLPYFSRSTCTDSKCPVAPICDCAAPSSMSVPGVQLVQSYLKFVNRYIVLLKTVRYLTSLQLCVLKGDTTILFALIYIHVSAHH